MQNLYVVNNNFKDEFIKQLREKKDKSIVMSYKEFIEKWCFSYQEETLLYIVKKYKVSLEIAKIYINNLYYLEKKDYKRERLVFLKKLKEELVNEGLIEVSEIFKEWLKNYCVIFYHLTNYEKDIRTLINDVGHITKVEVIDLEFLDKKEINFYNAKDLKEEVLFVCLKIRKLILNNVDINKIFISNLSEDYRIFFKLFGEFLNIPFEFLESKNIYSTRIIQEFINNISEDWKVLLEKLKELVKDEGEEDVYNALVNFCNKYVTFFKDEEFYQYVKEGLQNLTIKEKKLDKSVRELDFLNSEVDKDSYIFLVNVNQGEFPKVNNNLYFDNLDREELGKRLIYEVNELYNNEALKRINYYNNLVVSCKNFYLGQEYYSNSLLENYEKKEEVLDNILECSHKLNRLIYGKEMDAYNKYGIVTERLEKLIETYKDIDYLKYDNNYYKVADALISNTLSYSSLDVYQHCPFRYYLAYVLKLQDNKKDFKRNMGTLYHNILCDYYNEDFSLDKSFQREVEKLGILSKKEKFFVKKNFNNIKEFLQFLEKQDSYSKIKNVQCEEKIEFSLTDDITFKGIIDKLYYDDERVVVIDYKTGKTTFLLDNILVGLDMQLPVYLLLLKNSKYKDLEVVGFYLQYVLTQVIKSDFKHSLEYLKDKSYMLNGYSSDMESKIAYFDSSYQDSKIIQGLKVSSKGFYSYSKVIKEEDIDKIIKKTYEIMCKTALKIKDRDFLIRPKRVNGVLVGCEYCPYKEICYCKEENIEDFKVVKDEFLGGKEDGMD